MGKRLARCLRRTAALMATVGVVVAVSAGCGDSGQTHASASRTGAHVVTTTTTQPGPTRELARGRALFSANCAACHTLADAGAHGVKAGDESDFDRIRPNLSSVRNFLEHRFGAMPRFRGRLTQRQINSIARYVAAADGCGTRSPVECDGG